MRNKIVIGLFFLGCSAIFLAPPSHGQFGGGKKGRGGFGGGGGGMDPGTAFDFVAKGKPSVNISDLKFGRDQAMQYAKDKGITSGTLNRQQYIEFSQQLQSKIFSGGGKGFPGGGGKGKKGFGGPGGDFGGPGGITMQPAPINTDVLNQLADASFKKLDANGDGRLTADEVNGPLKFGMKKWDKNGDGSIDLLEYREFFGARISGGGGNDDGTRGLAAIVIEEEELDRKTVVYRAGGKMPAGLPPWFTELDKDEDGQVALYEWRKGGKDIDEFNNWDLNDDGFITPEEAVKHQATLKGPANASSGSPGVSASSPGQRPQFNGKMKGGGGDYSKGKGKKKGGYGGGNN